MSSIDKETVENNESFTKASQLPFGLEWEIISQVTKSNPSTEIARRLPSKILQSNTKDSQLSLCIERESLLQTTITDLTTETAPRLSPEILLPDTSESDLLSFQDPFRVLIRENLFVFEDNFPKEKKKQANDLEKILRFLDCLHKMAPEISFNFLQIMVPRDQLSTHYQSLMKKYGKADIEKNCWLVFFTIGEGRELALGSWEDHDRDGIKRSGFVWNFYVPFGQGIVVQKILHQQLEPLYQSLGFEVEKTSYQKDFGLNLSKKYRKKYFRHAIVLSTKPFSQAE